MTEKGKLIFGKELKTTEFLLDSDTFFTNHGSHGSVPKRIYEKKKKLQSELEQSPDKWFRYTSFDLWNKNIDAMARYLNVNSENILICENATESINAALKSIHFDGRSDAILATQYTYKAILNTIDYVASYRFAEENKVQVFKVSNEFPILNTDDILQRFDKMCDEIINEKKLRLRLAVIDHISSATAVLFPVKKICQLIRKWDKEAIILIDGAHCIGQTKIDLNDLECDFYVSNLHKWFFAPRGCAFLYLKDKKRLGGMNLQPNYISHGYDRDLSFNFWHRGNSDKTSWYVIDDCVDFYENHLGGIENISKYTNELLDKAAELLAKEWNTSLLEIGKDLEAPFMRMIKLPPLKGYQVESDKNAEFTTEKLMRDILEIYKVFSFIVYVQKQLYCRISCFVYNTLEDYVKLKDAVLSIKSKE